MNRDVPFDPNAICDDCGAVGAFDFMGGFICAKCLIEIQNYESTIMDEEDEE